MWKYLKDYFIGKLLDKWLITTVPTNSDAFIHYQNIELNTTNFNNSLLNSFDFSLNTGKFEELNVTINWGEIFRYWTEIRAKYHIETDDEDNERDFDNTENSLIKIKGLVLNMNVNVNSDDSLRDDDDRSIDEPVINSTSDVDLMKDFLNHIIGQFKVEIEGIKISLNEDFVITIPNIVILPEVNGLRRITVPEDITYETIDANFVHGRIVKGTEILIMRTIEGDVIKIKVPGIEVKANDLNSLIKLVSSLKTKNGPDNTTKSDVSIAIDTFELSMGPLTIFLHDIWFESTGSFIIGHFNLKLKDYSVVMSPIQTHVVTGDYKNNRVMVEEEIVIRLKDMKQIEEIKSLLRGEKPESSNSEYDDIKYQINMRKAVLVIDDINIKVHDVALLDNLISIGNTNVCYRSSKLSICNIKYTMKSNTISSSNISPFAELKRFIENDEIQSIEDETVLYENFKGIINNLKILNITGSVELEDLKYLTDLISTDTSNANNMFSVMGTVDKIGITLNLSNSTVYKVHLGSLSFLKAEGFDDLRAHLDSFRRNAQILMHSADLAVVKTDNLTVASIENLNLIIPYNLQESLSDDMKILMLPSSKGSSVNKNDFQITLKNSKIKLEAPDDLREPVESEFIINEVNCKMDVLYVDEAILKLKNETILNSGLIKINYDSKSVEVMNHCSNIYLDRVAYQNLIKFASFWSEIYSPVIEEIKPDAVFHDESSFIDEEEESEEGISGVLMRFEGDGDEEDFELELELSVTDTEETNSESVEGISDIAGPSDDTLLELLKDIDDEFFINKEKEIVDDSFVKISNFGIKINLILSESSNHNLAISLNGVEGTISNEKINLKIKEGSIHKNSKTILHRWPRGPDVTCKYPIEDGNFVSIKAEKLGIKNDAGIDELNLIISVCPLRLFLDQKSLNDMTEFFKDEQVKVQSNDKLKSFIFFNKVSISPLALKIDYSPNSTASSAPIPLQGAEMVLPRVELRGVKGFEGLGPAVFSAWIPELKGKKLTGVLTTGLVPVRTIVNLGGGVAELILLPWQLGPEQSAAQKVAQIRKNGKRIGLETLKLTASLASRTSKLLSTERPSSSASYPTDFQSGVQQAAQLIIALPTRLGGQKNKGALRAVPLIVLDSAATATGALAKTLQGIQAEFDKEIDYDRKIKKKRE